MSSIGEKIKFVCESVLKGKQIIDIAKELGVSDNTIRNWYKKDSVESEHLLKLSKLSGVPVSYFFEEEKEPQYILNDSQFLYVKKHKGDGDISQNWSKTASDCFEKLSFAEKRIEDLTRTITTQEKYIALLEKK